MRAISNIFWLGTKEIRSFLRDWVLVGLTIWAFSIVVIAQAQIQTSRDKDSRVIADADGNVEFFTTRMRRPGQHREMVIGRNTDERRIFVDRHQPRDRQIGFAGFLVFGDNGTCGDVGTGLPLEEARNWKLIQQQRFEDDLLLAGS